MRELKRVVMFCAGIIFLILGLAGLALPFLQGFLFLMIGISLLALSSPRFRTWLESYTRRYPQAHQAMQRFIAWLEKNIGKTD